MMSKHILPRLIEKREREGGKKINFDSIIFLLNILTNEIECFLLVEILFVQTVFFSSIDYFIEVNIKQR